MAHADVEHERRAGGGDARDQPAVDRLQGIQRQLAVKGMLGLRHELAPFLVLAAKGLDQGDGGKNALHHGVDLGFLKAGLGGEVADPARDPGDGQKEERNDAQRPQGQFHVHAHAHDQHAGEQGNARHGCEHAVHEQGLHRIGVAHDAVDKVAGGPFLMKQQGLALQMVKQVAAQILDHVLAHADGQVVVEELHEADQEMHADQQADHGGEFDADGNGGQIRGPAEDIQGLAADDLVHGEL